MKKSKILASLLCVAMLFTQVPSVSHAAVSVNRIDITHGELEVGTGIYTTHRNVVGDGKEIKGSDDGDLTYKVEYNKLIVHNKPNDPEAVLNLYDPNPDGTIKYSTGSNSDLGIKKRNGSNTLELVAADNDVKEGVIYKLVFSLYPKDGERPNISKILLNGEEVELGDFVNSGGINSISVKGYKNPARSVFLYSKKAIDPEVEIEFGENINDIKFRSSEQLSTVFQNLEVDVEDNYKKQFYVKEQKILKKESGESAWSDIDDTAKVDRNCKYAVQFTVAPKVFYKLNSADWKLNGKQITTDKSEFVSKDKNELTLRYDLKLKQVIADRDIEFAVPNPIKGQKLPLPGEINFIKGNELVKVNKIEWQRIDSTDSIIPFDSEDEQKNHIVTDTYNRYQAMVKFSPKDEVGYLGDIFKVVVNGAEVDSMPGLLNAPYFDVNAKVEVKDNPPQVTAVEIRGKTEKIEVGGNFTFGAYVKGDVNGIPSQAVEWNISDNTSASTTINSDGLLSVAENEKAAKIKVKATAKDTDKTDEVEVTIIQKPVNPSNPSGSGRGSSGGRSPEPSAQSNATVPAPVVPVPAPTQPASDFKLSAAPKMTESEAAAVVNNFKDTAGITWSKNDVTYVIFKGIMQGSSDGSFYPKKNVTRAELAQIVMNLKTSEAPAAAATDVSADSWYAKAVNNAVNLKVLTANADGMFRPNDAMSRNEMFVTTAKLLSRLTLVSEQEADSILAKFSDANTVQPWAKVYAATLIKAGVINGSNGKISADMPITREQIAAIFAKIVK